MVLLYYIVLQCRVATSKTETRRDLTCFAITLPLTIVFVRGYLSFVALPSFVAYRKLILEPLN